MKNFLKLKKVRRLHYIIFVCLLSVLLDLLIFQNLTGRMLQWAESADIIQFKQTIRTIDPVEKTQNVSEISSQFSSLADSEFRFISDIAAKDFKEEKNKEIAKVYGSIINFKGQALYPNSLVYLEINSEKIIASTLSDGNGWWSWTNYAAPLEDGKHTLEMYNIAPYEISGKRDVYVKKYAFEVKSSASAGYASQRLNLTQESVSFEENLGKNLESRLIDDKEKSVYLMQAILPLKKSYQPGETLQLQLLFQALKKGKPSEARIVYEIFKYEDERFSLEKVSQWEDQIQLTEEKSFVKGIKLKNEIIEGDYVLKITAYIDGERYLESQPFSVASKEVLKAGNLTVTEKNLAKIVVWHILVIFSVVVIILIIIALEYRRFIRCAPIDEDFLKQKGFFG